VCPRVACIVFRRKVIPLSEVIEDFDKMSNRLSEAISELRFLIEYVGPIPGATRLPPRSRVVGLDEEGQRLPQGEGSGGGFPDSGSDVWTGHVPLDAGGELRLRGGGGRVEAQSLWPLDSLGLAGERGPEVPVNPTPIGMTAHLPKQGRI